MMSDNCTDNVPVLIRRTTFCSAFAADARDFRSYNSWVRPPCLACHSFDLPWSAAMPLCCLLYFSKSQ